MLFELKIWLMEKNAENLNNINMFYSKKLIALQISQVQPLKNFGAPYTNLNTADDVTRIDGIWKDLKILSRFIQIWIQLPACLDHD